MLHQCNYNRTMYDIIGAQFVQKSIYALSLDFRGFGERESEEFDVKKIQTLPQEKRGDAWRAISDHCSKDLQLQKMVTVDLYLIREKIMGIPY
jgi:hypothetical protein